MSPFLALRADGSKRNAWGSQERLTEGARQFVLLSPLLPPDVAAFAWRYVLLACRKTTRDVCTGY